MEFLFPDLSGAKQAYEQDGYLIVRGILDAPLIQELNSHIDWLIEHHPDLRPETLGHWLIADDPFWVRFITDERLLDLAEVLVGPDIACFAADYIAKPPRQGLPLQWHQDGPYWPLEPMEVATVWFAVSASKRENGCVRVIPGSHRGGVLQHAKDEDVSSLLGTKLTADMVDESSAIDIELEPGDVSVHHPLTIHGSNANTSEKWRRGGSIQYMPTSTCITESSWPCAFLVRGDAVDGVNNYQPRPKYVQGKHKAFAGCDQWK